jgi:hypothetical protein
MTFNETFNNTISDSDQNPVGLSDVYMLVRHRKSTLEVDYCDCVSYSSIPIQDTS